MERDDGVMVPRGAPWAEALALWMLLLGFLGIASCVRGCGP